VAYFTENKAVKGSSQFTTKYQGATYEFESAANREAFNANPAKYAPQYGGYCAYGVASGHKADLTPQAFSIVDGKLYLNYKRAVRFLWKWDIPVTSAKPIRTGRKSQRPRTLTNCQRMWGRIGWRSICGARGDGSVNAYNRRLGVPSPIGDEAANLRSGLAVSSAASLAQ
jgi:YHS domain-containing protein